MKKLKEIRVSRYEKIFNWIKSDPKISHRQMAHRLGNKFPSAAMQVTLALRQVGILAGESGAWVIKGEKVPEGCSYQPKSKRVIKSSGFKAHSKSKKK